MRSNHPLVMDTRLSRCYRVAPSRGVPRGGRFAARACKDHWGFAA